MFDDPVSVLYTFTELKNKSERLKTYVNADRPEQINELYFQWQEWLTGVMEWLSNSILITNDSEPGCVI